MLCDPPVVRRLGVDCISAEKYMAPENSREGNYPSYLSTCFFPLTREFEVLMRIISSFKKKKKKAVSSIEQLVKNPSRTKLLFPR